MFARRFAGPLALLVVGLGPIGEARAAEPTEAQRSLLPGRLARAIVDPRCPADVIGRETIDPEPLGERCAASPRACARACLHHDDASACYWLAVDVQMVAPADPGALDLYQRACLLGVASGCTNRAAAMLLGQGAPAPGPDCELRSFARACAADDPWGCTMFAHVVLDAQPTPAEVERAAQALRGSCRLGEDDPACIAGQRELLRVEAARAALGE